jgi:hypothetical protein
VQLIDNFNSFVAGGISIFSGKNLLTNLIPVVELSKSIILL